MTPITILTFFKLFLAVLTLSPDYKPAAVRPTVSVFYSPTHHKSMQMLLNTFDSMQLVPELQKQVSFNFVPVGLHQVTLDHSVPNFTVAAPTAVPTPKPVVGLVLPETSNEVSPGSF